MKFIVYEVWTRSRVVEADNMEQALERGEPGPRGDDLSLSNWHAVEADFNTRDKGLILKRGR